MSDPLKDALKKIQLVSQEEAETAEFVVCGYPPPLFPEDIRTFCSKCYRAIVHRPHAPKKPPKICHSCFRIEFGLKPGIGPANITPSVLDDIQFVNSTREGIDLVKKKWG